MAFQNLESEFGSHIPCNLHKPERPDTGKHPRTNMPECQQQLHVIIEMWMTLTHFSQVLII